MAFLKRMAIKLAFCLILASESGTTDDEELELDTDSVVIIIFGLVAPVEELFPCIITVSCRALFIGVGSIDAESS